MNTSIVYTDTNGLEIAIVGMAGRFPGARNIAELWQKLHDGVECITFFSEQELLASGIDPALLSASNYVKARGILEDIENFDAAFFEFNPREAEILDPQHRLFLECAWEALEHAGYNPETYVGLIGVYAGIGMNNYFLSNVSSNHDLLESVGSFQITLGNDKDFLPTRVSYKLNLRGPSVNINTACSTSLVAIHLACQSLLNGECDMALAGGVSIAVPQKQGYLYQEGGILSPDGHCRAFDANAQGTVGGSGVGIVVVKRLADALADGDCIHAIIKGSAINNDGSVKVGYTAPSVNGQARVIRAAQLMAEVDAETITYVETHGTGTPLGDPIEIDALTQAFRINTKKNGFCAIGSVKTNVGHLDAAAGVTGLIKTVMALKHKLLPPSLHFAQPNPQIAFTNSPFYVNRTLAKWETESGAPRRAGVSSFGIGGTNAHVILEEAPNMEVAGTARPCHLVVFSARTPSALAVAGAKLVDYCKHHPNCSLADLTYTLQTGRKAFSYRRMLVCHDLNELVRKLEMQDAQHVSMPFYAGSERPVVFMFPGGGAQYANMASELYQTEPYFREQIDLCAELLLPHLGLDLRRVLYPNPEQIEEATKQLHRTSIALPALFATEYALARLWMAWGIVPHAMIGHSLGEYTAACLANVFSLEDALSLVVLRGKLFEEIPPGAMLSVPLPEHEVQALLSEKLSLAAINGPSQCVVAGPAQDIAAMAKLLTARELDVQLVHIHVAAHSEMVTPILGIFARSVAKMKLHAPSIPYISSVTGTWITAEEATDPSYWAKHLRQVVRFADGITELLNIPKRLLLEVGPGRTLSILAKLQMESTQSQAVFSSLRHSQDQQSDTLFLLTTLGNLWLAGVQIHWPGLYTGEQRLRIPLPTYPFEGKRFWIEPQERPSDRGMRPEVAAKKSALAEWFYIPSWKRSMPQKPRDLRGRGEQAHWLLLVDEYGLGVSMVERLERTEHSVTTVRVGNQFARLSGNSYMLNPCQDEDYQALFRNLRALHQLPQMIVSFWNITPQEPPVPSPAFFKASQDVGYDSLILLIQSLEKEGVISPSQEKNNLSMMIVANNMHDVVYGERFSPEKATLLGPCKVIPQEYPGVTCRCIDMVLPSPGVQQESRWLDQLLTEMRGSSSDTVIAYRGKQRWVQAFESVHLDSRTEPSRKLRQHGVYLITGGLGRVGLLLAEYLARTVQARLVLIGRSGLPPKGEWESWLSDSHKSNVIQRKIQRIQAMEEAGAEVLVLSADVADEEQMQAAIGQTLERFGTLHGVLHAAGVTAGKSISCPLSEMDRAASATQFRPKVHGVYVLEKVLRDKGIDFCLLFSSNAAILGGLGFAAYAAANLFMDAFSTRQNAIDDVPWISANWDGWPSEVGKEPERVFRTSMDRYIMSPQEAEEAIERVITRSTVGQVVVSTGDLPSRMSIWLERAVMQATANSEEVGAPQHQRPELRSNYVAPSNEFERRIAEIWQNLLGVMQIGIFDNFFELGGHSLLGTQLVSRLRDAFHIKLPLSCLFESPTVAELAATVVQRLAAHIDSEQLVALEQFSQDEVQTMLTSEIEMVERKNCSE